MFRVYLFVLLMCGMSVANGKPGVADVAWGDSHRFYHELGLSGTVSYPAFEQALSGYYKYNADKEDLFVLIDFTKPSTEERFCIVDVRNKRVLLSSHVSHGRGSGENYAVSFSNQPGSYKSSLGFFRTGETYYGKNGYSLILEGLEKGINDKARERSIVIHGANYSDPSVLRGQNRLGRSLGCPALPPSVSREVIDTIKNGVLLYIYGENKA